MELKTGLSRLCLVEMQKKFPGLDKRPFSLLEIKKIAKNSNIILERDYSVKFGLSYIERGRPIVLYNPHKSKLKRRHVIGHELAHIKLGHHKKALCLRFASSSSRLEYEADYIAASLVIPTSLFHFYFLNFGKLIPIDTVERFLSSSNPDACPREVKLFAKRRRRQVRNAFNRARRNCPYNWSCYKGKICPWASTYFL